MNAIMKWNLGLCWMGVVSVLMGCGSSPPLVEGPAKVWQAQTISFRGPAASQTDSSPNPFLDYRLQVTFRGPSGREYKVPGYFDGDGNGAPQGDVWRARFTPDEPGTWQFTASFRAGPEVAISHDGGVGSAESFDGASGSFEVAPRDSDAPGFAKWGRLEYAGGHYLKFRDGGYWIRGGTDSPENLLAYEGFVNTVPSHRYADHVEDWRPGDPDWGGGKGKAIIGALNYLASRNVNSIYFLTMNIGGDGKDVWPFAGNPDPNGNPENDNLHFDLTKLAQWEMVFDHAQKQGLFLHFVLNEAEEENKRELDDAELGTERKLYYREIIARFGHHLALQWNLCEEYNIRLDYGHDRVREFARYIQSLDPYGHPITVHSARDPIDALKFTFGDPLFSMTSIQIGQRRIDTITEDFWRATRDAGRPLPVSMDEFTIDQGQERSSHPVDNAHLYRKQKLWPTYLSGGMIEFILEGLLEVDSFKAGEKDALWQYVWHARNFMEQNLPFWEMSPADDLLSGGSTLTVGTGRGQSFELDGQVFAKADEIYCVYLPAAGRTGRLDLSSSSRRFEMSWFNPRSGEFEGEKRTIEGGKSVPLGAAPAEREEDWVILLRGL